MKRSEKCACLATLSVGVGFYCGGDSSFGFRGIVPVGKSVYTSTSGLVEGATLSASLVCLKELICA